MSLIEIYGSKSAKSTEKQFECKSYQPSADQKRCEHYIDGGVCGLPNFLMCVEWEKLNAQSAKDHSPKPSTIEVDLQTGSKPSTTASPMDEQPPLLDLLGHPVSPPERPRRDTARGDANAAAKTQLASAGVRKASAAPEVKYVPTQKDISSFKKLGVEVCLTSNIGEIFLVPRYTENERTEFIPEHLAIICLATLAFGDARISSIKPKRSVCDEPVNV